MTVVTEIEMDRVTARAACFAAHPSNGAAWLGLAGKITTDDTQTGRDWCVLSHITSTLCIGTTRSGGEGCQQDEVSLALWQTR